MLGQILHDATAALTAAGCDSPRLDAELLLAHALGCSRTQLHVRWRERPDGAALARFQELLGRREQREPVAYLVGDRAFYDVDLFVSPAVLVPRPETEHTVELALSWSKVWRMAHPDQAMRVVDVGTGSGALAIVLARHVSGAKVLAIDISEDALAVARRNVARYQLEERVNLTQGDLLDPLADRADLIVANLPYVCHDEIVTLQPDVAHYEPHLALDGGDDGLDLVRRIARQIPIKLACPGLALFEIDPRQACETVAIMRQSMPDASVAIHRDLAGRDRVVSVERSALPSLRECS